MEEGLFIKYGKVIQQKKSEKESILQIIKEKTGITFEEHEVVIQKNTVTFHTSSSKRSIIIQKNIKNVLQQIGYTSK